MPIAAIYGPDDFDKSVRQPAIALAPSRSGERLTALPMPSLE